MKECARDADDPARMTNAGEILQCGFRSFALTSPVAGTGLWPP